MQQHNQIGIDGHEVKKKKRNKEKKREKNKEKNERMCFQKIMKTQLSPDSLIPIAHLLE